MGKYIDLDALVPEDVTVKFDGKEYKIPADIDLETSAKLINLGKSLAENPSQETVKEFERFLEELLSIRQKPPKVIKMTMTQALAIVKAVSSAGEELAQKAVPFAES